MHNVRVDPGPLLLIAVLAALYVRAIVVLRRRGRRISRWQQSSYAGGLLLTTAGLVGPVDTLSADLLSAHMVQHLLIADIAAPLMLIGIRTPVLQNLLPPVILRPLARERWLRRLLRTLKLPWVAIPVFVVLLYTWHFAFAFDAALRNPWLHAFQHLCFVFAAGLVWWPVIEPEKARLRGELWKAGHVLVARFLGMMIAMAFVLTPTALYAGVYDPHTRRGMSAIADQRLAGGLMFSLDILAFIGVLAFFFWRAAADYDRDEAKKAEERATAAT
jgi:cytochrome c oxidase assembly factor CtaG